MLTFVDVCCIICMMKTRRRVKEFDDIMHDIWNPWHGCHKCSPGCDNCYMYYLDNYRGVGGSNIVHRTGKFDYPLKKWRTGGYKIESGEMIRVNMTSDTFVPEADEWRDEMWSIIKQRSDVLFWILTKRPERMADHMPSDWGNGYPNVIMNITTENQKMFDKRYQYLLDLPARHKGIVIAPMIGPVMVEKALMSGQIEMVQCGGENYGNPRWCRYEWVKSVSDQCRRFHVNFCWYESGSKLKMGDDRFEMPSKRDQQIAAFFSNLNLKFYDIPYDLKDPETGEPIGKREKLYNKYHCTFCANRQVCNGCSGCGDCGNVERVSLNEIKKIEEMQLMLMKEGMKGED